MVKAVFAGSFDPPTNGHLDIIKRASGLFESVDVVVSVNPEKKTMFTEEERVNFLSELIKPFKNVSVHSYKGIIVNYAKEVGAKVLVRGV
nr:pantetheine-phosphate adenylyltransferase [Treponema sp.]